MHLLLEFLPKLSRILIPDSFFSFLFGELLRFDIFDLIFCSLNILREDFKNKKKYGIWKLGIYCQATWTGNGNWDGDGYPQSQELTV